MIGELIVSCSISSHSIEYFFAFVIVKESELKVRVKVMGQVIQVAKYLFELNNFNIANSIVKGLSFPAVERLQKYGLNLLVLNEKTE